MQNMQKRFARLVSQLTQGLFEKEEILSLGLLALCAGESLFLLGPPGTAKSLVARRLKAAFHHARSFEYLMGRFSTPEELFGPLSIAGLRDRDVFERRTEGYLPQADIVFLDEIWRASPPIQNSLLSILNEKVFRNGAQELQVPLKLLIGASNDLPLQEENSEAFWDRFLLRLEVFPIQNADHFVRLLQTKENLYQPVIDLNDQFKIEEWFSFRTAISAVRIGQTCLKVFLNLKEKMASLLYISDRRWKKAAYIVKTVAFLHEHLEADLIDLGILEHMLWHDLSQKKIIRELLYRVLEDKGWDCDPCFTELEHKARLLKEDLRSLILRPKTVNEPHPFLYEGEYFSLIDYPGPLQARIWAQDFQLLKTEEESKGEIFFFQPNGTFLKSEKHFLRASQEKTLLYVDEKVYTLESRYEEITIWEKLLPEKKALQDWENQVKNFIAELKNSHQSTLDFIADKTQRGQEHLFSSAYTEACCSNLHKKVNKIEQLIVQLEYLLQTKMLEE